MKINFDGRPFDPTKDTHLKLGTDKHGVVYVENADETNEDLPDKKIQRTLQQSRY